MYGGIRRVFSVSSFLKSKQFEQVLHPSRKIDEKYPELIDYRKVGIDETKIIKAWLGSFLIHHIYSKLNHHIIYSDLDRIF